MLWKSTVWLWNHVQNNHSRCWRVHETSHRNSCFNNAVPLYLCLTVLVCLSNSKQVCYELNYYYSFSLMRIQRLTNVCNSPRVVEAELRLDFRSLIPCPQILPWGNIPTRMVDSSGSRAEITQPRAKSQRCFFCTHPHPPYTGRWERRNTTGRALGHLATVVPACAHVQDSQCSQRSTGPVRMEQPFLFFS